MNKKFLLLGFFSLLALFAIGCSSSDSSTSSEDTTDICTEDPNAPGCAPEETPDAETEEI